MPLRCAPVSDADAPPVALADLLAAHELFVPDGASDGDALTLSGSLDDEGRALSPVTLLVDGELGAITTAEGRRLSQMKIFSIGKASALAASGLVDVDVLKARKKTGARRARAVAPHRRVHGLRPLLGAQRPGRDARHGARELAMEHVPRPRIPPSSLRETRRIGERLVGGRFLGLRLERVSVHHLVVLDDASRFAAPFGSAVPVTSSAGGTHA